MMSVSAMSGGQGNYYAGLAQEDYYLEGGEPPGLWMGEGAKRLGLSGKIDKKEFLELFDGRHNGEKLVQNADKENHRPGWDLTFSAPKTVSTAWSQADRETALEIQAAHLSAVEKAVQYLEQNALFTRRGKGGKELEFCEGVVATFEHGTSRAQDPQLHTHALLLNVGVREDGKTASLETSGIYIHKMAAGVLYRAELAYQLERRLGLFAELRAKDSCFDIQGVSNRLADTFSKRRHEIEEALSKKGVHSARAAEIAALDTRGVKGHIAREELFEKWQAAGKEHGWSREHLAALMQGPQPKHDRTTDLQASCLQAIEKITQQKAYFTERDVVRHVAEAAQTMGAGADAVLKQVKGHLENSREIVLIGTRFKEGVFSTKSMLQMEKDLMKLAKEGAGGRWNGVSDSVLNSVNKARPTMKMEQKEALRHITQKTGTVVSVIGMAGTGKTFMLDATREALEASGYRVIGAALAGKAAEGLQEGSGIKSSTIASLFKRLEKGYEKLDAKTVLVLDEAGMVGTRQMHELMTQTRKAGAKLVLMGDEKQLQPIEAGGPFGAISREIGTAKLTDIVRQREKWQRQAVKDFAAGEATKALTEFAKRGFVTVAKDREEARESLVTAWKKKGLEQPENNLIVAATNADAKALNRKIQELRLEKQGKEGPMTMIDGEKFFAGDRILFTRNSSAVGVKNGTLGTILSVNHNKVTVALDNGKKLSFSTESYGHAKLGYAVTTHKAQGATVENVFILTDESMQHRELTYVQASRAKNEARFFTTEVEAGEKLKELAASMQRSQEKLMALDFGKTRKAQAPEEEQKQKPDHDREIDPDLLAIQQLWQRTILQREQDRAAQEKHLYQEIER